MEWKKFTIKTTSWAEDIVSGVLADLGIYSVEIEDSVPLTESEKAQMFVDIAPLREESEEAYVSFYIEETEDWKGILSEVQQALMSERENMSLLPEDVAVDLGELTITTSDTEDEDWINNWKQFFKSFYIDDICFKPSWEEEDTRIAAEAGIDLGDMEDDSNDNCKMVIHIDPGTAFGTGKHETTQLCIKKLREVVKAGDVVLDVGTGSGILAMMALKFGAAKVYATDLDPCSLPAVKDNFEKNDLADADFTMVLGNLIDDKKVQDEAGYGVYDIVVANILADVLIPLTKPVVNAMKDGALFITSGIIEGREDDVAKAMEENGLTVLGVTQQGEWRCVTGVKK